MFTFRHCQKVAFTPKTIPPSFGQYPKVSSFFFRITSLSTLSFGAVILSIECIKLNGTLTMYSKLSKWRSKAHIHCLHFILYVKYCPTTFSQPSTAKLWDILLWQWISKQTETVALAWNYYSLIRQFDKVNWGTFQSGGGR